jgi:hypothetical protein
MIQAKAQEKNYKLNCDILTAEILDYKQKIWEDNRFCQCGAESLKKCACESEKKKRFLKRRKRKVNEKYGSRLNQALKGEIPTTD